MSSSSDLSAISRFSFKSSFVLCFNAFFFLYDSLARISIFSSLVLSSFDINTGFNRIFFLSSYSSDYYSCLTSFLISLIPSSSFYFCRFSTSISISVSGFMISIFIFSGIFFNCYYYYSLCLHFIAASRALLLLLSTR